MLYLFPISGHRGHVRPGEDKARGVTILSDFELVENVTVKSFRRFSLEHRSDCDLVSVFQERLQGTATALPFPFAAERHYPDTAEK